ncbi:unnamed protein product, partial [Closterium sp. Naga37s-1]
GGAADGGVTFTAQAATVGGGNQRRIAVARPAPLAGGRAGGSRTRAARHTAAGDKGVVATPSETSAA